MINALIIVGAPRSGTNALRDALTSLEGTATWACDEINFVWKYQNESIPNDELKLEHARPSVRAYIRKRFKSIAGKSGNLTIEKTCANSLRVGFVKEVLPEAKFVYIERNPLDSIASAMKRWSSGMELGYTLKKLKHTPLRSLPYLAGGVLMDRLNQITTSNKRLRSWGPIYDGMDLDSLEQTLPRLCANQWGHCTTKAKNFLGDSCPDVYNIMYEDLVSRPFEVLSNVCQFANIRVRAEAISLAASSFRASSVGKGAEQLGAQEKQEIHEALKYFT